MSRRRLGRIGRIVFWSSDPVGLTAARRLGALTVWIAG
jgi:hypothetical protein